MKILAVDTTATSASVAVCENKTVLATYTQKNGLTHSETLLPMIEATLKNLKLTPNDIDMFAVSEGPGSFTGVRIGVAALKGLAFGKNKICVGTSTLDALARNACGLPGKFLAVPVMDARRGEVYNALFEIKNGKMERLCDDRVLPFSELLDELNKIDKPVYFCGDAYFMSESIDLQKKQITPYLLREQNAYSVAQCAFEQYASTENKEELTDKNLSVTYLRMSQAERERKEREAKNNE